MLYRNILVSVYHEERAVSEYFSQFLSWGTCCIGIFWLVCIMGNVLYRNILVSLYHGEHAVWKCPNQFVFVQNHSAEEIHADESDEEFRQLINAKRQRIDFPPARAENQWESLDSSLVLQLDKLIGKSTLEHMLSTFGDIVYQTCLYTFGVKQHQRNLRTKP